MFAVYCLAIVLQLHSAGGTVAAQLNNILTLLLLFQNVVRKIIDT